MEPDNRITLPGIKDHQWYKGNVLKKEELAQEVKELHKLVEIARKDDAEKMKSLQESNKRAVSKVATIDYDSNETKKIAVILRAVLVMFYLFHSFFLFCFCFLFGVCVCVLCKYCWKRLFCGNCVKQTATVFC